MLKLVRVVDEELGIQEFQEDRIDNGIPSLADYNPILKKFATIRTAYATTGWEEGKLNRFLSNHPDACIYNIVSHEPIPIAGEKLEDLAEEQLIATENQPYIDLFGRYVYILSQVSWRQRDDIDTRFDNGYYPEQLEPEILIYQS